MEAWEIILIIFIILILLGGIALTIYLIWRHEKNRSNNDNNNNNNNNNNNEPKPPSGITGSTGLFGGNFAIRPVSDLTLRITPDINSTALYVSGDTGQSCSNYTWQNKNYTGVIYVNGEPTQNVGRVFNALVNLGAPVLSGVNDPKPYIMQAVLASGNNTILELQNNINTNPANWLYNTNNKTWCLLTTNNCLYYDGNKDSISIQNGNINSNLTVKILDNGNILSGFQWENTNNVSPPTCISNANIF